MVFILFPDLSILAKLIAQMSQEKIQILFSLWKCVLERVINLLDSGWCLRVYNFLLKKSQIFLVVL